MTQDELGLKALEAIRENRVKLYIFEPSGRKMWVVVGKHGRYLVLPGAEYCSCNDFFFRVISGEKPTCYHLLAVRKAIEEEAYTIIRIGDASYIKIFEELLSGKAENGAW